MATNTDDLAVLDAVEDAARPVLSDSELSDVDEEAYAGIDTSRIGIESDDEEGPNVFDLKPAKRKTGTGERKKKRAEDADERRRKRQERRQEKEEAKKRKTVLNEVEDEPDERDPSKRPDDPEAARRWDLDRVMESAMAKKPVKRRKKDEDIVILPS